MNISEILIILAMSTIILSTILIFKLNKLIANSPDKSERAKKLYKIAQKYNLNYIPEKNGLKKRLLKSDIKINLISGKIKNKKIIMYDIKVKIKNPNLFCCFKDTTKGYISLTNIAGKYYIKEKLYFNDIKKYLSSGEVPHKNHPAKLSTVFYKMIFTEK